MTIKILEADPLRQKMASKQHKLMTLNLLWISQRYLFILKKMVYVSGGQVVDGRSPWRLSYVPDLFWGFINFIVLFFKTLVNPSHTSKGSNHSTDYRVSGRGQDPFGPGGGPRRRMGGFRGGPGGPSAPPMAGGG